LICHDNIENNRKSWKTGWSSVLSGFLLTVRRSRVKKPYIQFHAICHALFEYHLKNREKRCTKISKSWNTVRKCQRTISIFDITVTYRECFPNFPMWKNNCMLKGHDTIGLSVKRTFYYQIWLFLNFKYDIRDQRDKLRLVHTLLKNFQKKVFSEVLEGTTGTKKVISKWRKTKW
jgi:hypothetical protein